MPKLSAIESHNAAGHLFDRVADSYKGSADTNVYTVSAFVFARRKQIVLSLIDASGASGALLDFGMGPGVFATEVVRRGFHFIGIDLAPAMVERARALELENATFVQGDLDKLAAYHGAADVVMAIGVIDYLEDVAEGLRNLVQCLKPGGTFIISFRNRYSLTTLLRETARAIWRKLFISSSKWRQRTVFASGVQEKSFNFRLHLKPLLTSLGISDIDVDYFDFSPMFFNIPVPKPLWVFWYRIDKVLARPLTQWMCSSGVLSGRRVG